MRAVAGVILAAGASSRLGAPKQRLSLEGRPLLQHVIDAAAAAGLDPIVVVLGHRAAEVEAALDLPDGARIIENPEYAEGQSSSLRRGLAVLNPEVAAAAVLLGDQPRIRPQAIRAALAVYEQTGGPVVRSVYRDRPGHPVILGRGVWPQARALTGDHGARDLLADHPEWVVTVEHDEDPPVDVNTLEDYERLIGG